MWKSAYVGVYQLLNWKMHGETLKFVKLVYFSKAICIYIYIHIRVYERNLWATYCKRRYGKVLQDQDTTKDIGDFRVTLKKIYGKILLKNWTPRLKAMG